MPSTGSNGEESSSSEALGLLPVFALNTVCFPGHQVPLRVFEERYVRMLDDLSADRRFVIALISHGPEVGGEATPFRVGTLVDYEKVEREGDIFLLKPQGRLRIYAERFERQGKPYLQAECRLLRDEDAAEKARPSDKLTRLESLLVRLASGSNNLGSEDVREILVRMRSDLDLENYSLFLCGCLAIPSIYLQRLLENRSFENRLDNMLHLLSQLET